MTSKEKGNEKEEYAPGTCRENNSSAERLFKGKGRAALSPFVTIKKMVMEGIFYVRIPLWPRGGDYEQRACKNL